MLQGWAVLTCCPIGTCRRTAPRVHAGALGLGYSNIFVTAPSPENLRTLFDFVFRGLDELGYKVGTSDQHSCVTGCTCCCLLAPLLAGLGDQTKTRLAGQGGEMPRDCRSRPPACTVVASLDLALHTRRSHRVVGLPLNHGSTQHLMPPRAMLGSMPAALGEGLCPARLWHGLPYTPRHTWRLSGALAPICCTHVLHP